MLCVSILTGSLCISILCNKTVAHCYSLIICPVWPRFQPFLTSRHTHKIEGVLVLRQFCILPCPKCIWNYTAAHKSFISPVPVQLDIIYCPVSDDFKPLFILRPIKNQHFRVRCNFHRGRMPQWSGRWLSYENKLTMACYPLRLV